MTDIFNLTLITSTFLLAGTVKGVIGLGLPLISLSVFTVTLGLEPAMALLLVPSLVTNAWQAATGGNGRAIAARIWPFLLAATATVWFGTMILKRVDVWIPSTLLGVLISTYALFSLLQKSGLIVPTGWDRWVGPVVGSVNGVFAGLTGAFVFPGIIYLQGIGLSRDLLVQALGMLFTLSTIALAFSLGGQQMLTRELAIISSIAVLPALAGMAVGRRLRHRMTESVFRQVFHSVLLLLGLYVVWRASAG